MMRYVRLDSYNAFGVVIEDAAMGAREPPHTSVAPEGTSYSSLDGSVFYHRPTRLERRSPELLQPPLWGGLRAALPPAPVEASGGAGSGSTPGSCAPWEAPGGAAGDDGAAARDADAMRDLVAKISSLRQGSGTSASMGSGSISAYMQKFAALAVAGGAAGASEQCMVGGWVSVGAEEVATPSAATPAAAPSSSALSSALGMFSLPDGAQPAGGSAHSGWQGFICAVGQRH